MAEKPPLEFDLAQFERLIVRDRAEWIAIASSVVRDRNEAEDVVQDTIAAVWQRLPTIAPDKVSHYLARAIRQNARKRKSRRREHAALQEIANALWIEDRPADALIDPLDLEEAIRSLPIGQRNAIRMKYFFGMTFGQIGVSLSISTHTAASRCRYAIAKLKRLLLSPSQPMGQGRPTEAPEMRTEKAGS